MAATLWEAIPAVKAMMADFKESVVMITSLLKWVFSRQPAFQHTRAQKDEASADKLQSWETHVMTKIMSWISEPEILADVKALLLEPVKFEL